MKMSHACKVVEAFIGSFFCGLHVLPMPTRVWGRCTQHRSMVGLAPPGVEDCRFVVKPEEHIILVRTLGCGHQVGIHLLPVSLWRVAGSPCRRLALAERVCGSVSNPVRFNTSMFCLAGYVHAFQGRDSHAAKVWI